jgi:hypothetical protein
MRVPIHRQNRSRTGEGWKSVDGRDRREDTGAIEDGIEAFEDSPVVAILFIPFLTLVVGANGISQAKKTTIWHGKLRAVKSLGIHRV